MGKLSNNYACPFCACIGKTTVTRTINHRDCIIRTRRCNACNKTHTTVEVSYNIAARVKAAGSRLIKRTGEGDAQPVIS